MVKVEVRTIDISFTALCVLYMLTQIFHYRQTKEWQKERKDLYDRIMSKDLQEYKEHTEPPVKFEPVTNDDQELYYKEIEDMKR